jgi:hypothetical protein
MIISSTVAILITQIVGFLLFIAINSLVAILAYKLGTYDYKVSIDEGWYNYLISYGSYQFSTSKRLLVLITFILLLLSHFYATLMSSGYSYNWSLINLGSNHQFSNWSLTTNNLVPVSYQNINFTSIPWLTENIDNLNKIVCYAVEGCGMGSDTSNFTLNNGDPIASQNIPLSVWQHNQNNAIGYNLSGVLLSPVDLLASNGASAVQSNSACYLGSPLINYEYGGSVSREGLSVNHDCFVDDYTGLVTLLRDNESGTVLYSIGAMSASLPGAVGRFSFMMVGVSQSLDILSLYNNVTVAVLTTVKVSRGLSLYGAFNNSTLSLAISNIGDNDIEKLWNSTGLYNAVISGNNITEESWSLTDQGLTGHFIISGLESATNASSYQVVTYNISIAQLNLSSIVPGSTLNVFSNNVPDFTLMDDFTYTSQATNITLTSDCGLSCMQFSSITIAELMSLNSSLQNVIRSMVEGTDLSITLYSYVNGFMIPPSWIAINVVLVVFTILLVILMIIGTPIHYKSTLRQVIINSVPDDEDSPKLTRAATELSLMKINELNNIGVAIDGKPIRTIKDIVETLPSNTSKIDSD